MPRGNKPKHPDELANFGDKEDRLIFVLRSLIALLEHRGWLEDVTAKMYMDILQPKKRPQDKRA